MYKYFEPSLPQEHAGHVHLVENRLETGKPGGQSPKTGKIEPFKTTINYVSKKPPRPQEHAGHIHLVENRPENG